MQQNWWLQAQLVLMAILVVSLANFLVGSIIGPSGKQEQADGFYGFDGA